MSVGVIRFGAKAFDGREAGVGAVDGAGLDGLDFQALLAAARTGTANEGLAVKTESSRTVSMLGNVRRTIITYADGSSDIQTSVVQDGIVGTLPKPFASNIAIPARPTIRANSDLEPEKGGEGASHLASIARRFISQRHPASVSAHGKARPRIDETAVMWPSRDPQDIRVGRLLDLMV